MNAMNMRVWLLLLVGCGVHEHTFDSGPPPDPTLKGDGATPMLSLPDADVDDTWVGPKPGCEPIAPYDAGPRTLTLPCGPTRCNPDIQYCEATGSGVMGGGSWYHCSQAPIDCRSKVTCACLKQCGLAGDACDDIDGGAIVSIAGQ